MHLKKSRYISQLCCLSFKLKIMVKFKKNIGACCQFFSRVMVVYFFLKGTLNFLSFCNYTEKISKFCRLLRKELPASYLEEHAGALKSSKFPPEVVSMMRAIRVFGHLEEPVFLELCRRMVSLEVKKGELLFQPGDADDSVYMVQKGCILVYITDPETSRELPLKEVKAGESIASMLSILDILSGHEQPFKTVTSRAQEPSTVLRMPVSAFGEVLEHNPEALVRVVQLIMTRLQRVTFSALRDYLGLSHELMKSDKSALQPANAGSSPCNDIILNDLNSSDGP
jgi:CRP-like cAMP-binding protein